jgi:hypothetical protein
VIVAAACELEVLVTMNSSGVLPGARVSTRPTGKPWVGLPSIWRSSSVTFCVFPVVLLNVTTIR